MENWNLTPSEAAFAESHHGLLVTFIRRYKLDDDCYGALSYRFLKTVRRYLEKQELQKYTFSTILWYDLRSELSHIIRKDRSKPVIVPDEGLSQEYAQLDDLSAVALWSVLEGKLDEVQIELVRLRSAGRTNAEIAAKFGISKKAVECRLYRIKKKIGQFI